MNQASLNKQDKTSKPIGGKFTAQNAGMELMQFYQDMQAATSETWPSLFDQNAKDVDDGGSEDWTMSASASVVSYERGQREMW